MPKNYTDINSAAIDQWVRDGWEWGQEISHETYLRAKQGDWSVLLTPTKPVPKEWFCPMQGAKILGLASGGGQQIPIFTALGAQCTVLDYSQEQLRKEELVAQREGYDVELVRADMSKPLPFADESFDLIFHPVSNCYVKELQPIWNECYRVLKKGGILLNFDADYASNVRNQNTSASHISDTEVYGHCGVTPELEQENASITLSMPMSRKQRPYWDQEFLENIGFSRSGYDPSVGQNILKEHDLKDAPMFLVWGVR